MWQRGHYLRELGVKKGLNIVIVEEPCLSRNVLLKALRVWGYDCVVAESEAQAWAAVKGSGEPRLVLADWHADFLECDEFFERLRANPAFQGTFILGGVPRGAVGAIRRCVTAGADDCISRPYDLDEVRLRLRNASLVMGLAPDGPVFPEE